MPKEFKFALQANVRIRMSSEVGVVTARAEYSTMPDQYQIQYVNAAGCAVEQWWEASLLDAVIAI